MRLILARPAPVGSLLLVVLLFGCRAERMETVSANPRKITFTQAGVSIDVGEQWECQNLTLEHSLYPPTLVSRAGSIKIVLLPPDRTEPAVVADGLRASFDLDRRAAKHSFRRQQFANDKGVRGLCVSYREQAIEKGSESGVEHSHYLLKNRAGRCVVINYVSSADIADTSAIHRMVRSGLSLQ